MDMYYISMDLRHMKNAAYIMLYIYMFIFIHIYLYSSQWP